MDEQDRVAAYVEEHDLRADPAYRLLDLASEVGELATDAVESTDYGTGEADLAVAEDEVGDALFALLAFAESQGIDAGAALAATIAKMDERIAETGDPSSRT